MLDKKGMFLIDALMALLIVGILAMIVVTVMSMHLKSNDERKEFDHVEELYQEATRLHND